MRLHGPSLYGSVRWIIKTALGFYFSRIERFHPERVPASGPVLFTSNHPNSSTDAFVIGTSVPRKVNFVGTVQLFRLKPVAWLLSRCGVIPINRLKDDPRAMRTVLDTFEGCFRVLEQGEAIAIFPEGTSHDDPQLKTVKTGAARIALELEHRHAGRLGLHIMPVGLTFSAKEIYRSEVLVNFGEPIRAADFLAGYPATKHEGIHRLTVEIEQRIEALILHLPKLERARIVAAVKRLYLDHLLVARHVSREPVAPRAEELMFTQAIARVVDFACERHPDRATAFVKRLNRYELWLQRLRLSDEEIAHLPSKGRMVWHTLGWALLGVAFAPVAAYGWLHRLLPYVLIDWSIRRYAALDVDRTHVSTAAIVAGVISFTLCYGAFVAIFHVLFGLPASLWYALSLPVASLLAHYYLRGLRRFAASLRAISVFVRLPLATRRLRALRADLIADIESTRRQIADEALGQNAITAPPLKPS